VSSETDGAGDAGSSSDAYTHDPAAFGADGERVDGDVRRRAREQQREVVGV